MIFDVIVVGGGPAGLSAALMLGRCRRRVLVCDLGQPRNRRSRALHGYLTRDGVAPGDFGDLARGELAPYEVQCRAVGVRAALRTADGFDVTLNDGTREAGRYLLLATGVVDELPDIGGLSDCYGRSVFHCPYCDGWEVRDQPLAIYGRGARGYGLSLELTAWSRDLVLCTDGPCELNDEERTRLERHGIRVREDRLVRLEGRDALERIVFEQGGPLERRAVFFTTGQSQQSHLAHGLGCQINEKGTVLTGKYETTHLPGLYVAGDASRAVQWVVVAAAEGAEAAFAINTDLLKEDLD